MAIDERLNEIRVIQGELQQMQQEWRRTGGGSNGGGVDGMIDRRVTRLEDQYDKLREDSTKIQTQLATLTERVAHLPGKGYIVTALATTVAVLSGIAALARQFGFFG